jgi:hypothetical protein
MAHKNQEACQLFIEQEIQKGLDEGKTPYSIGKDLAVWIEKLFEASIPQETLERRADRAKKRLGTNVPISTTPPNHFQIPEKQENPPLTDTTPGPGRLPKYAPAQPPSDAMYFASLAISQLERIRDDDPKRTDALDKVISWCEDQL